MTNPNPAPAALPAPVELGLKSLIPGIVRTFVPVIVGLLVKFGLAGILDSQTVEIVLSLVVTMGYYALVRILERHWDKLGFLLGYPSAPVYVKGTVVSAMEVDTPPTTTTVIETDTGDGPVD